MRSIHSPFPVWRAALAGLLLLSAGLVGCPKHEDFPADLDLVIPPTPESFVITYVGPNASGGFDYDLSWSVDDATTVVGYRIYILDVGPTPDLVAETPNTVLPATFQFQITGLRLAVSAVSTGYVEGHTTIGVAP